MGGTSASWRPAEPVQSSALPEPDPEKDSPELVRAARGLKQAVEAEEAMWSELLNKNQQDHLFIQWRSLRSRCYDLWMEDIASEQLGETHDKLRGAISRCQAEIRRGSNHVRYAGVCHEDITSMFEQCQA